LRLKRAAAVIEVKPVFKITRRKLRLAVTIAALLLAIGTGACWVRSYFAYDFITAVHDSNSPSIGLRQIVDFRSSWGGVSVNYYHSPDLQPPKPPEPRLSWERERPRSYPWQYSAYPSVGLLHVFGFEFSDGYIGLGARKTVWHCAATVPYWFLVLFSLALSVIAARPLWRRLPLAGFCPACGYDLRASPDRCPECGLIPRRA